MVNIKFETIKDWFVKIKSIANRSSELECSVSTYSGNQYLSLRIESIKEIKPVHGGYNELYLNYRENDNHISITYNEIAYDRYHDSKDYVINEDDTMNITNGDNVISYAEFVKRINDYCKEIIKRYGRR